MHKCHNYYYLRPSQEMFTYSYGLMHFACILEHLCAIDLFIVQLTKYSLEKLSHTLNKDIGPAQWYDVRIFARRDQSVDKLIRESIA